MTTQQAITSLWKAGYRANASTIQSGYIVALDPIKVETGFTRSTEFKKVVLHNSQVSKFISDRS